MASHQARAAHVVEHALMWSMHADKAQLHAAYSGRWFLDPVWNGAAAVAALVLAATGTSVALHLLRARRSRSAAVVGLRAGTVTTVGAHEVWALPTDDVLAYSVAGGGSAGAIVVSRGSVDRLSRAELLAVVEHEAAHLRRRHHRVVVVADSLGAVVSAFGLLRGLRHAVRALVEMDADDAAVRECGVRPVARALLTLARPADGTPAALALGSTGVGARVRRLAAGVDRPVSAERRGRRGVDGLTSLVLIGLPPAVSLLPGLLLWGTAH